MSWSVSVQATAAKDFPSAVDHAEPPQHLADRQREQLKQARDVVKDIAGSGVLGEGDDCYFAASLSGHGGGEEPVIGDVINLSVTRVTQPADA